MRFDIRLEDKAAKYLKKLDKPIQVALISAMEDKLALDPFGAGKPLRFALKGQRRIRVGKYRIIYKIREEKGRIHVTMIGLRKNVYG